MSSEICRIIRSMLYLHPPGYKGRINPLKDTDHCLFKHNPFKNAGHFPFKDGPFKDAGNCPFKNAGQWPFKLLGRLSAGVLLWNCQLGQLT